jgi:hypothetical protein
MIEPARKPSTTGSLYVIDLNAWAEAQAELLREQRFDELDLANPIDEVSGMGGGERQQIESRLDNPIGHLSKCMYQPGARDSRWVGTVVEQRRRVMRVIKASPSLKRYPATVFDECYLAGRRLAARETGIDLMLFPEHPPFSLEQVLDLDFMPREPSSLAR